VSTAKDLWQPPRFQPLEFPAMSYPSRDAWISPPNDSTNGSGACRETPTHTELTIDNILSEIKSFTTFLSTTINSCDPLARHEISTSDKVYTFERRLISLIHNPPPSHTPLDNACSIAALMSIFSFIGNMACTSRVVEAKKLQVALAAIGNDLGSVVREPRGREKMVWALVFGARRSLGEERGWFVSVLKVLCEVLRLKTWGDLRETLDGVLWANCLDQEGMRVWEEIQGAMILG
jgi:hypothetical protein